MEERIIVLRERVLLVAQDIEKQMTKELAYEYLLKEIQKALEKDIEK